MPDNPDVYADRLATWAERMNASGRDDFTVLAEQHGRPVGFAHVIVDADPVWGALLDNLHVAFAMQRKGVGSLLLDRVARILIERRPGSPLYLWVLEQNSAARAFYLSRGGTLSGREPATPPGDDPRNLAGSPRKIRVAWSDPASLILQDGASGAGE